MVSGSTSKTIIIEPSLDFICGRFYVCFIKYLSYLRCHYNQWKHFSVYTLNGIVNNWDRGVPYSPMLFFTLTPAKWKTRFLKVPAIACPKKFPWRHQKYDTGFVYLVLYEESCAGYSPRKKRPCALLKLSMSRKTRMGPVGKQKWLTRKSARSARY